MIRKELAKGRNARSAACAPLKLVSALLAPPHAFSFGAGHFVCRLTSDAKSRAPIKAQRNKGAACLGAGPPRSRAPFTFVKEINLPLLSAGRGQSGRKRDACCRPGGGGGNLSSEAGCSLGEDKLPPPLPPRRDNSEDPHTHNPLPTTPAALFGPRPGPLPSSSSLPSPEETQKT